MRKAESEYARTLVSSTIDAHGGDRAACLAVAVAPPTEANAAVLKLADEHLKRGPKGRKGKKRTAQVTSGAVRKLAGLRRHLAR